ncbi:flippase [Candidatus Saccharibacteria bacterium]|nr:flippase [Candidatus Saccharibacteria bacterium]
MAKKISSTKKNFLYNSLYQILLLIIPLITTPYIARVLGAEEIGSYSYAHAIAYYFVIFIMLGLNNYGNRTIACVRDDKEKLSKVFSEIYTMQVLVSVFAITLYIIYATFISNNLMTWVMLIYVVSAAFDINWLFFGLEKFKLTALRSSTVKILSMLSIFIFVKSKEDVLIYALINVLASLVSQLVLWFYLKKDVKPHRVPIRDAIKHLKPNLVLFIPIIAISLYKMMDKIMLGNMSSLEQVGFYESTEKFVQVPLALITSLGTVMMPKISNLVANNNHTESKKYIEKSLYFAMFISSAMCFGIMAIAKDFVPWYYGPGFEPCVMLLQILMPSCMFLAIANVVRTQHLIPYKYDSIFIWSVVAGAIINLIANSILIPQFSANGAAVGTLMAEAGVCISQIILTRKNLKIWHIVLKSTIYLIIGIVVFLVLIMVPNVSNSDLINIIYKVLIGGAIYLLASLPFLCMQRLLPEFKNAQKGNDK